MAKTPIWDAAFLKERERDAQEQAEQAQFDADWQQAGVVDAKVDVKATLDALIDDQVPLPTN